MNERRTNALGALAGFLAAAAALGIVYVVFQTFQTTQAIEQTQDQGAQTLALIKSCTTPSGSCAQQNTERTGEVIELIEQNSRQLHQQTRRIAAIAAACADKPGTQTTRQIAACIRKEVNGR